jgi:two-component system, OmpR family, response regulator ChvI
MGLNKMSQRGHRLSIPTTSTRVTNSNRRGKKRILLVDDEPDITISISAVLESNDLEVTSYNDPVLALSSFKPHHYDLVMLDVKMPKIDGFELYNEIKKIDIRTNICFITATDKNNYEGLEGPERQSGDYKVKPQLYCELKKDMFLQKPISNDDLVNEINKRTKNQMKK